MLGWSLLLISSCLAIALLAAGLRQHLPPLATGAEAQNCCWAPQGKETRCYPCRPTRETR